MKASEIWELDMRVCVCVEGYNMQKKEVRNPITQTSRTLSIIHMHGKYICILADGHLSNSDHDAWVYSTSSVEPRAGGKRDGEGKLEVGVKKHPWKRGLFKSLIQILMLYHSCQTKDKKEERKEANKSKVWSQGEFWRDSLTMETLL